MAQRQRRLLSQLVSRRTTKLLQQEYRAFQTWCGLLACVPLEDATSDAGVLCRYLVEYIQFLFDNGESKNHAKHAILAVQHRFRFIDKRELKPAWDSIKSWEALRPGKLRTPCPHLIASALFVLAVCKGLFTDVPRRGAWLSLAVGILCCFHGLLRVGEFCNLTRGDVRLPDDSWTELGFTLFQATLVLRSPKNQRSMGRNQVAVISDLVTVRWLSWLCYDLPSRTLLMPGGTTRFRGMFKELLGDLGLAWTGITPASLRAGGTTHLFELGTEISRLRFLGRWRSIQTLDHYVQEAAAAAVLLDLSPQVRTYITSLLASARRLRKSPSVPWTQLFTRARQYSRQRWTSQLPARW